jgi:hypothetical protein
MFEPIPTPDFQHPFKLQFTLHTPSDAKAYEHFLEFLSNLEEEYGDQVISESFTSLDEKAGYYGQRRHLSRKLHKHHKNSNSIKKENPYKPRLENRSRAFKASEQIYGYIYITDCSKVHEIAKKLADRPDVVRVSRHFPNKPLNRFARYTCSTGADEVDSMVLEFTDGETDVIGVSDTGIDMTSCFFHDNDHAVSYQTDLDTTVLNPNHRKIMQYISFADSADDADGHGTHVSGTIAGNVTVTSDITSSYQESFYDAFQGMSSSSKIAFYDIGYAAGYLETPIDLNEVLFSKLLPSGAKIFSNSWGAAYPGYDADAMFIDKFMWENPDTLVLFAAGNDGLYGRYTVGSPATGKNSIAIGASSSGVESWEFLNTMYGYNTTDYNIAYDEDTVAYFSSRGPTIDGRMKPDVMAPGYYTFSAAVSSSTNGATQCGLALMAGTSMATPTAAGFASRIRRYFKNGYYPNGWNESSEGFSPSGALIKAIMIQSARAMKYYADLRVMDYGSFVAGQYPSIVQGYGRMQLNHTLRFTEDGTTASHDLFVIGGATKNDGHYAEFSKANTEHRYRLRTNSSAMTNTQQPLRITLSYTDYPTTGRSYSDVMINWLDLSVNVTTTGEMITPYLTHAAPTVSNVQVIDIENPLPDTEYIITIAASRILKANQSYALVVTGSFEMLNEVAEVYYQSVERFSEDFSNVTDDYYTYSYYSYYDDDGYYYDDDNYYGAYNYYSYNYYGYDDSPYGYYGNYGSYSGDDNTGNNDDAAIKKPIDDDKVSGVESDDDKSENTDDKEQDKNDAASSSNSKNKSTLSSFALGIIIGASISVVVLLTAAIAVWYYTKLKCPIVATNTDELEIVSRAVANAGNTTGSTGNSGNNGGINGGGDSSDNGGSEVPHNNASELKSTSHVALEMQEIPPHMIVAESVNEPEIPVVAVILEGSMTQTV